MRLVNSLQRPVSQPGAVTNVEPGGLTLQTDRKAMVHMSLMSHVLKHQLTQNINKYMITSLKIFWF
jgi:hypothetical protein